MTIEQIRQKLDVYLNYEGYGLCYDDRTIKLIRNRKTILTYTFDEAGIMICCKFL